MEFVQIKRRVCGKSSSFWWCKHYCAIWSNSWEHSKNVFAVNLGHWDNVHEFWWKYSPNVLENQTRLQNSAYNTRKSLIFRVLCILFEQNSIRYKSWYSKQEAHGPRFAHLSDIATADMQMLCNIYPILSSQLMKISSFEQFLVLKKNIWAWQSMEHDH